MYMEQAWSCRIICEIKRHRRARWGCFLWVESLFYGNWNRQVCLKWKCEVDRSSRSTGVGLDKKQKCCSLSCVFSQAQQNASHYGNFQTFVCLQTKRRHQCTEKLEIYFFHIFYESIIYLLQLGHSSYMYILLNMHYVARSAFFMESTALERWNNRTCMSCKKQLLR